MFADSSVLFSLARGLARRNSRIEVASSASTLQWPVHIFCYRFEYVELLPSGQPASQSFHACRVEPVSPAMYLQPVHLKRSQQLSLHLANMAYRLQPTRLVEVLLPVLAVLYHETEVPAGSESLPGSYLTQMKTLVETRMVRIKAQLFLLAAELLPADKLKRLHSYCESLRGYDEWQEVRLQRRNSLSQLAMTYYAMAKLREPTELGWSRLAGFLYDCEGASRETQILGHTQALLPDDVRLQFEVNAEVTRQGFFKEDAVLNVAIAAWDLRLNELLNAEWS